MYNDKILGYFSCYSGGHIFLAPGLNMQYDSGSASCIHEMYHAYLTISTNIGILMHFYEMEINLEKEDVEYKIELLKISKKLYDATRVVQEAYANTLEILWLKDNFDENICKRIYNQKTEEYIGYLNITSNVWKKSVQNIEEQRKFINNVCRSVLNIDITTDIFWSYIDQFRDGKDSCDLSNNINERLVKCLATGVICEETKELKIEDFINIAQKKFKHIGKRLETVRPYLRNNMHIDLNDMILKTICTFELAQLDIKFSLEYHLECDVIFAVHNVIINKVNITNGIVQFYADTGEYNLVNLEANEIDQLIFKHGYVVVFDKDFDFIRNQPRYVSGSNFATFVMISDIKDLKKWLVDIGNYEEIYIGDLNNKSQDNFFTIIFFRKRNCDHVIYMCPTINVLSNKLYYELGLKDKIRNPGNGLGFYDVFSYFNGWPEIIKILKNIVSFVTNTKGNILCPNNTGAPLFNEVKFDFGNNILKIECENSFKIRASFPTIYTNAEPFWIIMELIEGENTGNTYADNSEKRGIVYFDNKKIGTSFLHNEQKRNNLSKNYHLVGLDGVYWKVLKEYLIKKKIGMIYYTGDLSKCVWYNVEQFDYLRNYLLRESIK